MDEAKPYHTMIFLRHGETIANSRMIASGGERNPQLTQIGISQIVDALTVLQKHLPRPGIIITSPLKRSFHSARIVADYLNLEVELIEDLKERMLGDWNDMDSKIVNPMLQAGKVPPNGESRADYRNRTIGALNSCLAYKEQTPIIVGSRGTARILLEMVEDKNATNFPNGGVLKLKIDDSEQFELLSVEYLN